MTPLSPTFSSVLASSAGRPRHSQSCTHNNWRWAKRDNNLLHLSWNNTLLYAIYGYLDRISINCTNLNFPNFRKTKNCKSKILCNHQCIWKESIILIHSQSYMDSLYNLCYPKNKKKNMKATSKTQSEMGKSSTKKT